MTGPRTPFLQVSLRVPNPRRPTHESLVAFADLVDAALTDARRVLTETGMPGEEGRRPGGGSDDPGPPAGGPAPSSCRVLRDHPVTA